MIIHLREKKYPSGSILTLAQGDITLAEVDAIVNPANQLLQHGGGLAGLLSKKAGPSLQRESNLWVEERGPISHASPAHTTAGELPFRAIIHAVGPVWGSGNEKSKLEQAVFSAIKYADQLGMRSLAIPAISTGIFGYPLKEASRVILEAADSYCSQDPGVLTGVQIILYDNQAAEVFAAAWDEQLI